MSNENIDIDNLLDNDQFFKPLTDGLGFHHSIKEKKEIKANLSTKSIALKEQLETRAQELKLRSTSIEKTNQVNMGELAPFYNNEVESQSSPIELHTHLETLVEATMFTRFGAWIVDLVLITSIITVALVSIIFTSQIPLSYLRENILDVDLVVSFFSISILFYSFYFSFFDKTTFSSPGKRMLGLKVVSIKGSPITFVQAFSRVIITMISAITLGLGCVIKVQDKLTDTVVVKK